MHVNKVQPNLQYYERLCDLPYDIIFIDLRFMIIIKESMTSIDKVYCLRRFTFCIIKRTTKNKINKRAAPRT